jgi:hypothetical protein
MVSLLQLRVVGFSHDRAGVPTGSAHALDAPTIPDDLLGGDPVLALDAHLEVILQVMHLVLALVDAHLIGWLPHGFTTTERVRIFTHWTITAQIEMIDLRG